ncbi:unnamed protein product [Prorocentrum cordatum]|uniref:Uncharacterized protein n=1 Tax=Prorocentrum cordatum TaxID=2364126 RepID=A0ABN9UF17_9DINO|nr:unnamed protein product [Polarella glacialis]
MVADASVALATTPAGLSPVASTLTLLAAAVEAGEADTVSVLLKARADPCAATPKGVSPLHLAAYCDSASTLGLLVEARADVDAPDCHGQSPIFFAGTPEICSQLEAAGADVNLRNRRGQSALHLAAGAGLDDVVAWLAARVAPGILNAQDRHGCTALHCARSGGLRSTARLLQERGASDRIKPVAARRRGGGAARAAAGGACRQRQQRVDGRQR